MNSRSYDNNVPPLASNTVTIATSSTSHVRQPTTGQVRPMTSVPMRQPVPIRKLVQDTGGGGASTSGASAQYPIKEEVDNQDYPSASTSSGPLIGPSNSFQQYQRGAGTPGPTSGALVTSNNGLSSGSMAMDQPAPVNLASKVAEVFLTAGHAFQKLGDLTLQLHTTTDSDESKWSEKEVDGLKNALTRFAHELDQISTCVANRTTKHIKNDIKRRHIITSEDHPQQVKRMTMSAAGGGGGVAVVGGGGGASGSATATYAMTNSGIISSGHAVPMGGQKRVGGQPINKMIATRTMIPTTRYTVASIPGSSNFIPSSTAVIVNSSQSPQSAVGVGMPQLQSQSGSTQASSSTGGGPSQRILAAAAASTSGSAPSAVTRVMATTPQMIQGGGKNGGGGSTTKRIITTPSPVTSGAMSIPASGALVLEQND